MNHNLTRDETTVRFGPSGDTTAPQTINSLSEITAPNESLWRLIGADVRGDTTHTKQKQDQNNSNNINNDNTTVMPTTSQDPAELLAAITYRKSKSTNQLNEHLKNNGHLPHQSSVDDAAGRDSSIKRNPEEMVRQLQVSQKKRPTLITSERQIEAYKNEILQLKLQLYHIKTSKLNIENLDIEGAKTDIVSELTAQNDRLKKELDERDRKDRNDDQRRRSLLRDSSCQTNLDSYNIEELFKAKRALDKINQQRFQRTPDVSRRSQPHAPLSNSHTQPHTQQQQQQQPHQHQYTQTQQQRVSEHHDKETPVVSQLSYPHTTIPQQRASHRSSSHKQLLPDEKALLEELFNVDGILTVVRDKLRAQSDTTLLP